MSEWVVIYQYPGTAVIKPKKTHAWTRGAGFILLAIAIGGMIGPLLPMLRLESSYAVAQVLPTPIPPLRRVADEATTEFNLIIPKIGVNSPIIPGVDPNDYTNALKAGVAHSITSFFPDQDGTVYLFSHSTSADIFVKELNAVFYLLKNLVPGDTMQIHYHGKTYTYTVREKKIVNPKDISYLVPLSGTKSLILETCWPPGSTAERLLVLADLTETHE